SQGILKDAVTNNDNNSKKEEESNQKKRLRSFVVGLMMIKEDKVPVIYSVEPPKPKVISGPQMPVQGTKNQGVTVPKAGSKIDQQNTQSSIQPKSKSTNQNNQSKQQLSARTGLIQNPKQKTDLIQGTSPRTSLTKVPSPISQIKNKSLAVKAAIGMKTSIPPKKINLV
ncbi:MAG: hypothetical protein EZS28_056632, partial [Streblomastix strix]